jgi:Flp pilus assembly protein TadD
MNRPSRFGSTISTLAIVAVLSGCAAGQQGANSLAAKAETSGVGFALRAQGALESGQFASAVQLAEQAVQANPDDSEVRALLANCYFAGGRFASAEQAYRDSLTLNPSQPKLVLKLALVEIAQGRDSDALAALDAARSALDPADYGLAIALAGRPDAAVEILNEVARTPAADARVRQNLALAYGLSGDWTMAKTVAAQDLAPDQVDSRIQQWMSVATPTRPSDQVAMLTGVHPTVDPGQPQALALKATPVGERLAQLLPRSAPQRLQPQPEQAQPATIPATPPPALPDPEPAVAQATPAQSTPEIPAPVVAEAARSLMSPPVPQVQAVADEASASQPPVVKASAPAPVAPPPTRFDTPVEPAKYVAISDTVRRAADEARNHNGRSNSVVQLGAYSSPDRVAVAWDRLTKRYPALASYTPMRARFNSANGVVWRLSIKGFSSEQEAIARCEKLQSRGGQCFVRHTAGDAPVEMASR